MTRNVIYINGPSSSGKTTLAHALQDALDEPYLHVSVDALIAMMPAKVNDWTGTLDVPGFSFKRATDASGNETFQLKVGPYARKINPAFHAMVRSLLESGFHLIIDDIAFGKEQVELWHATLQGYNVVWVGLIADIETLETRERLRGDRLAGSARDQAQRVHDGVTYDLLVSTDDKSMDEIVAAIMNQVQPSD